jgi:hypothetical protein
MMTKHEWLGEPVPALLICAENFEQSLNGDIRNAQADGQDEMSGLWTLFVGSWGAFRYALESRTFDPSSWRPLIHDIFGHPYYPVALSPSWRTDTTLSLARQMYDSRDFGAMPILADALQDAGCEEAAILEHCRDANQPHVRGCWVVDLVLGKE